MAIGGFVCSLLGLLCLGPIFGVTAIVLGAIAMGGMNWVGNPRGKGFAIAAVIIGILDIVTGILLAIYFIRHPEANPLMRKF